MGTIYKEIIQYENRRLLRVGLSFMLLITAMDIALIISDISYLEGHVEWIGYAIIPVIIMASVGIYLRVRRKFRYSIIANELIIERIVSGKRKVALNLNINKIVRIEKVQCKADDGIVGPKFLCSGGMNEKYRCVFKGIDGYKCFCFEPSKELLKRIEMVRGK